jgi:S-formylglutathione hydrolase FrmB
MMKMQITLKSMVLLRPVQIFVGLPYGFVSRSAPYKCLWLLHSAIADAAMYSEYGALLELADRQGSAVVAPSLGNNYFVDSDYEKQATFLKDELFPALRQSLSISPKREDNALIGVSMGGYGVMRWALDAPGDFSAVASISAHYSLPVPLDERAKKTRETRPLYQIFYNGSMPRRIVDKDGELLPGADLRKLMDKAKGDTPRIGLFCGDEDYLSIEQTKGFYDFCQSEGIPAELFISEGMHNPAYWDAALLKAAKWVFKT